MNQLVKQLSEATHKLSSSSGSAIATDLNIFINDFFGAPLKATSARAIDVEGKKTDIFSSLIYNSFTSQAENYPVEVQANTVGCVIPVFEMMDLEKFRKAYFDIATAKRLKKEPTPNVPGVLHTTITLGVIFAKDSSVPLEILAEELNRLNQQTPSEQWTDMIAIMSQGIINYSVQFPSEQLSGDFLPPSEGALQNYIPPIYVVIVMKPTGAYTLHHMIAFIAAHLALFSPGAKLPDNLQIREGTSTIAITYFGYQYNLHGQLKPVPRGQYNDRYLPPRPLLIYDPKGKPMCAIQFIPWQDGGVVLLRGKTLPLEGLLVFAGKEALKGGIIKRGEVQISHVIPMTAASFSTFLANFQQRSNMTVRTDPSQLVMQKIADEGASSPFMARLFISPLTLRDTVFELQTKRDEFSNIYQIIITNLMNLRITAQDLTKLYNDHVQKVSSGQIARVYGSSVQIDESVNRELKRHIEDFLNGGVRVIKHGIQNIAKMLQINIGFLFQQRDSFERGIATMRITNTLLADYLEQTRLWSERFMLARNAIEHDGWQLADVTYTIVDNVIKPHEPQVSGQSVTKFVQFMLDRILCFVEEITTHCMQLRLPYGVSLTEIHPTQRVYEMPIRFQITLSRGGMPIWHIAYHIDTFESS